VFGLPPSHTKQRTPVLNRLQDTPPHLNLGLSKPVLGSVGLTVPTASSVLPFQYGVLSRQSLAAYAGTRVYIDLGGGRGGRTYENVTAAGIDIFNACHELGSAAGIGQRYQSRPTSFRARASADPKMARTHRIAFAGHAADVHRAAGLLCAVVANVLGSEPRVSAVSGACQFRSSRCDTRSHLRARPFEPVVRAARRPPPPRGLSKERWLERR